MAKMVLAEPPEWTSRRVELNLNKPDKDARIEIFHKDTDEKIIELSIEERTRALIVKPFKSKMLKIDGEYDGPMNTAAKPKKFSAREPKKAWRKEKDGKEMLICALPSGQEIELEVHKPGPLTPKHAYEIKGQPEMMFALMLGIKHNKHSLLTGPTGIAKTSMYRWLAKELGYNLVVMQIARGTQDRHLLGEYAPVGPGDFKWMDGPVTKAARLSNEHPTILLLDELNRIGNIAEFSRVYSLLDDSRQLELSERRSDTGAVEIVKAEKLYIGATANPVEDEGGDYIGVKELDPAFNSRFLIQPKLDYPAPDIEARALQERVGDTLDKDVATAMVKAAQRIRKATEVRFPISFRELEAWAIAMPYYGYKDAAEVGVVQKAHPDYRADIRNLLKLQG